MSENNSMYVAGKSGNLKGRPKGTTSVQTVRGRVNRFVTKNMSAKAFQALYNRLTAREQAETLVKLLPYVIAPASTASISAEDIDNIYKAIEDAINGKSKDQKAG